MRDVCLICDHQRAYCSSPVHVTYEHGELRWNDIDREKLRIRPPELSGNSASSHLAAKQEGMENEMINFATKYLFNTRRILQHSITTSDMGPMSLLTLQRKNCCGLSWPSAGFEPSTICKVIYISHGSTYPAHLILFHLIRLKVC
jgi:hypothetical protein